MAAVKTVSVLLFPKQHRSSLQNKKRLNVGENGGRRHHRNNVSNRRYLFGQAFFRRAINSDSYPAGMGSITDKGADARSKRETTVNFLGRRVLHEWVLDEKKWYPGVVTDVLKGKDSDRNGKAVYKIQYEGEDEPYEVDTLLTDCRNGSVKFKDL